jgi:hypothetical protein
LLCENVFTLHPMLMKIKFLHFAVAAATLLSIPTINFAQGPNLGTAANFVLFTTVGAVGNTGISHLTGNVGSNSGSTTGFGNVNGVMHNNNGATSQAAQDLLFAYNEINGTPHTFSHAPLLGNGDTLIAGVYAINGLTTLAGNLILDARGNSNAVFIFKIGAAFSTQAESKVKLINGAMACNVYWKVEGMVGMAAGTSFKGNLIVNNAAINMSTRDTLEGRALSTTGAVNITGTMAYTPVGCGSALLKGPAAPNLATTACYAIFSGNGSVANAGVSHATGDIGSNVGLTTGFDPLLVKGQIHPIPDGSTSACAADLLNVYSYLNTLTDDIELLYPAQFGHNLVLTPHTYVMKSATSFTDTLYLNGQGNPDAVFVIKITGALGTSTNAKVILTNGTQAKNVFWKVDGAISISDNSEMKGTFIANNAAIDLKTGVIIDGRALTTNGALSTAAVTVTVPAGTCGTLMPLTWMHFRGNNVQENVLLEWGITNEVNNGFFKIEKSRDGKQFETLATIDAETGKTQANYSFTDLHPFILNYYRISQTDNDGRKSYSATIQVKRNMNKSQKPVINVQAGYIYVQTAASTAGKGSLELYSIEGRKVSSQKIVLTKEVSLYKIEKPAQTGTYLLQILNNGVKMYAGKVMVF